MFLALRYPFESDEAKKLNRDIFEAIYFAALEASMQLAKESGSTYESYAGSPASKGILQFDMWPQTEPRPGSANPKDGGLTSRWRWDVLRQEIKTHGLKNSLLVAPMPTASTAQILGNNESFEPYTSNLFVRQTQVGQFIRVSRYLLNDLMERKLWSPEMKQTLMAHNGSIQNIEGIPDASNACTRRYGKLRPRL